MGPIALFDKSFLQSLSVDEAVWFDHFFIASIAPIFFVETLADLEKAIREGRTPEQEVGMIAEKTPVMHGAPSVNHLSMGVSELLGHRVSLTGRQIPVAGGRFVKAGNNRGVVFKGMPEAEAFARWQRGEFLTVERQFARGWREALAAIDLNALAEGMRRVGIDAKSCRSLHEAKGIAAEIVEAKSHPFDRMKMAVSAVATPASLHESILARWIAWGKPSLPEYAPYVAHILTVELFFQIALASHLIGTERPSNLADVAYLFYLPQAMVFISGDRLHRRCAPLFLRPEQQFVWAPELKAELRRVNEYFASLPEETKEKGILSFARVPPGDAECLLPGIWDRHFPGYRDSLAEEDVLEPTRDERLTAQMREVSDAAPLSVDEIDFDPQDADSLVIERLIPRRRGSWWQIPRHLDVDDE